MTAQSNTLNDRMAHLPAKLYIGNHNGERIYLSRPSFDCDWYWYWGFGYLGNRNCHYHLNGVDEGKNINFRDALLAHFGESFIIKNDAAVWKFAEIVLTIYTLKKSAELFHLGGSHMTTNPGAAMLKNAEWEREINEVLIPAQILELYKILLPEGCWRVDGWGVMHYTASTPQGSHPILHFKLALDGQVLDASTKFPEHGNRDNWTSRWDFKTFEDATRIAHSATQNLGTLFVPVDSGPCVSPRYDVAQAPKVGDKVSYGFNGDYYPDGEIVNVFKTLQVTTSTGNVYRRRKQSGSWLRTGGNYDNLLSVTMQWVDTASDL